MSNKRRRWELDEEDPDTSMSIKKRGSEEERKKRELLEKRQKEFEEFQAYNILSLLEYLGLDKSALPKLEELKMVTMGQLYPLDDLKRKWPEMPAIIQCELEDIFRRIKAFILNPPEYLEDIITCGEHEELIFSLPSLNAVRHQLNTNNCAYFSAADTTSFCYAVEKGEDMIVDYSKQELVDNVVPNNEEGASHIRTFDWIEKNRLCRESDYEEYHGMSGPQKKKTDFQLRRSVGISGYDTEISNLWDLEMAVLQHPVAAAINVDGTFYDLKDEIYRGASKGEAAEAVYEEDLHGVVVVGYCQHRVTKEILYWVIKNSWGESWGVRGYGKVASVDGNGFSLLENAIFPTFS